MAEQHRMTESDRTRRDEPDPGAIAEGDAQLDASPPNAVETEPPSPDSRDGNEAAMEAEQIESDLEALQRDFSTLSDRHLRLAAEFDNYRKRIERERADNWSRAQADLAARLLDTLDDMERVSLHADGATAESLLQGVQLVERKLRQALEAAGLETVDAEGKPFDPNSMEAVATVPTESADQDDTVSDVFQRGYRFKGQLIRPSRVRVRKHEA